MFITQTRICVCSVYVCVCTVLHNGISSLFYRKYNLIFRIAFLTDQGYWYGCYMDRPLNISFGSTKPTIIRYPFLNPITIYHPNSSM